MLELPRMTVRTCWRKLARAGLAGPVSAFRDDSSYPLARAKQVLAGSIGEMHFNRSSITMTACSQASHSEVNVSSLACSRDRCR